MSRTIVVALLSLVVLALPASAQVFEPLPLNQALELAATEGVVCLVAYRGETPDPDFEALLADPALAEWLARGAVAVLAPTDPGHDVPYSLHVDWRPALAAVQPDGERVRYRVEDWQPAAVVAWLEQVAQGRGQDDARASFGRESWERMQRLTTRQFELQLLLTADRLEELSERLLEDFESADELLLPRELAPVPWGALRAGLARGDVDAEPWYELLIARELPLRRGDVRPDEVEQWLWLLTLLDAHERLAPAVIQAIAAGADALLDEEWSRDRSYAETRLADELCDALLEHATPADSGALIPDLTGAVHDALGAFRRASSWEASERLWDDFDGPQNGSMQLSETMLSLSRPMGAAFEAQGRREALDMVAAAYHAAVAAGRRDAAWQLTTEALEVVGSRDPDRLPELLQRLGQVDQALRAAGLEPLAWVSPPADPDAADATDDDR